MSEQIIIRPIEESDFEEWSRLCIYFLREYSKYEYTKEAAKETFERFMNPNEKIGAVLAVDTKTNKVIGFTNFIAQPQVWSSKELILMQGLYVDENIQAKGVGRRLMDFIFQYADNNGTPEVYWNTDHDNHRAQLLYTKIGVPTGQVSYKRNPK